MPPAGTEVSEKWRLVIFCVQNWYYQSWQRTLFPLINSPYSSMTTRKWMERLSNLMLAQNTEHLENAPHPVLNSYMHCFTYRTLILSWWYNSPPSTKKDRSAPIIFQRLLRALKNDTSHCSNLAQVYPQHSFISKQVPLILYQSGMTLFSLLWSHTVDTFNSSLSGHLCKFYFWL